MPIDPTTYSGKMKYKMEDKEGISAYWAMLLS